MKMPRFITEYANYKITEHEKEMKKGEISEEQYISYVRSIDRVVNAVKLGLITVDDAMHTINQN